MKRNGKKKGEKKIKQWKLTEEEVRRKFEENVKIRMEGNTSGWKKLRDSIMEAGREIFGETTGRFSRRRETWWWNKTVQQRIKEKNEAYKK